MSAILGGGILAQERLRGLRAGDQHRHEQGKQEQRHNQLMRACFGRQRGHQSAHRGDTQIAEHEDRQQLGQRTAQAGAEQQQPEGGNGHELDGQEHEEEPGRLGHP